MINEKVRVKKNSKQQIEGVVGRERRRNLGDFSQTKRLQSMSTNPQPRKQLGFTELNTLDDTAETIDGDQMAAGLDEKTKKQSWFKRLNAKRKARRQRINEKWAHRHIVLRVLRRSASTIGLLLLLIALILGIKSWLALNSIVDRTGDVAAVRDHIDKIGRINILLVGIGGEQHEAGDLADSIIIASIDPFANDMVMLSVPRDMYVTIPDYGSDRINATHVYGERDKYEGGGVGLLSKTLEENLGVKIHYYVRADFQGFIEAVDTVGGIEVTLDRRIYDPNFDWQYGPNALDLQEGVNQLDGQTALLLARARGANGGSIGLERSDFDRADNQRLMLVALKDKVLSAGTYANPLKISSLIDTVGSHVRTNLNPPNDLLDLHEIAARISNDKIKSIGLNNGEDSYLISGNVGGASVLLPRAGDYSEIQAYLQTIFLDAFLRREAPKVDVYNGSGYAGVATTQSELLKSLGYSIGKVDDAPKQDYTETVIYDINGSTKPRTKELLQERYGITMLPGDQIPRKIKAKTTDADFVIIIGQDNAY